MLLVESHTNRFDHARLIKFYEKFERDSHSIRTAMNTAAQGHQTIADSLKLMDALTNMGYNPIAQASARLLAGIHEAHARFLDHLASPIREIPLNFADFTINGEPVQVREEMMPATPFYKLAHLARTDSDGRKIERTDPKLLILVPASGHGPSLLQDTIAAMAHDHEVYVLSVNDATHVPKEYGEFDIHGFIDAIISANETITAHNPYGSPDKKNIRATNFAICQPGPCMIAAASLMAESGNPAAPVTLAALASPIDVSQNPTAINEFARSHPLEWFESSVIFPVHPGHEGEGRKVYPGHLQRLAFTFKNQASAQNHFERFCKLHSDLMTGDHESVERKTAFDRVFFFDIRSLFAGFYLTTLDSFFQKNQIGTNSFTHNGQKVDAGALRDMGIIAAEGKNDDVCGPGQTSAIIELAGNIPASRKVHGEFEGGHYMFAGSIWEKKVAPWMRNQIRKLDEQADFSPPAKEIAYAPEQNTPQSYESPEAAAA